MNELEAWKGIPALLEQVLAGADLDTRRGAEMTLREVVHHLVEAHVVSAGIIVAALGSPGCVFDWSWMLPFGPWMERMAYDRKPIEPSLRLLAALNDWVAAQIEPLADGLAREVKLRDEPEGPVRSVTVAELLRQEVEHAREHVSAVQR
jgi:hypothetical protein